MHVEQAQHTGFVAAHLPAKAHHVGEHDRRQLTGLGRLCAPRLHAHGGDYATRFSRLSNRATTWELVRAYKRKEESCLDRGQGGFRHFLLLHTVAVCVTEAAF